MTERECRGGVGVTGSLPHSGWRRCRSPAIWRPTGWRSATVPHPANGYWPNCQPRASAHRFVSSLVVANMTRACTVTVVAWAVMRNRSAGVAVGRSVGL